MNSARSLSIPLLISIYSLGAFGQVVDVNGDNEVGPHEAIAVSESWKGPATAANDHDHLGQTWTPEGEGRPLRIRGYFPDGGIVFPTSKGGKQIFNSIPYAPLILDNTAFNGSDLLLGGELGIIRAVEEANSSIVLRPNRDVTIFLNEDGTGPSGVFAIRAENGFPYFYVTEDGDMELSRNANIGGDLDVAGMINGMEFTRTKSKGADTKPPQVMSGEEPMHVVCGKVTLDADGKASIKLPTNVSNDFEDFLYQLTPIGDPAPSLHVAAEFDGARFQIAGGISGMTVCWQVTGIR